MKIYDKRAFAFGLLCSLSIPMLLLGIIPPGVLQWCLSLGITGRYLYLGLSREGARDNENLSRHYREAARALYGKRYYLRTDLPLLLLAAFFVPALLLRLLFDIYTPAWLGVLFVLLLAAAAAYSIGVNRKIREYIRQSR